MAYLSSIPLNPLRPLGRTMLANPHVTHAVVLQGIPSSNPGRGLWRLETSARIAQLVVLTPTRPSWAGVIEQAGWPGAEDGDARIDDIQPLLDLVQLGRELTFKARLNPVETLKSPKSEALRKRRTEANVTRGARVPHRTAAQQTEWLLDPERLARWGFDIPITAFPSPGLPPQPDVELVERRRYSFKKRREDPHTITLSTATFLGHLRITDPVRFTHSLLNGIGHAKGYGCGLITLGSARPRQGGAGA
jgi:CRISPR system Cascade subunit CasE